MTCVSQVFRGTNLCTHTKNTFGVYDPHLFDTPKTCPSDWHLQLVPPPPSKRPNHYLDIASASILAVEIGAALLERHSKHPKTLICTQKINMNCHKIIADVSRSYPFSKKKHHFRACLCISSIFPEIPFLFQKHDLTLMDVILWPYCILDFLGKCHPSPKTLNLPSSVVPRVAGSGIQMSETCLQLGCGNLGWDPAPNKQPPLSHRFDTFPPPQIGSPLMTRSVSCRTYCWWSCFADGFLDHEGPLLFCFIPV